MPKAKSKNTLEICDPYRSTRSATSSSVFAQRNLGTSRVGVPVDSSSTVAPAPSSIVSPLQIRIGAAVILVQLGYQLVRRSLRCGRGGEAAAVGGGTITDVTNGTVIPIPIFLMRSRRDSTFW